ncbi:long-chain fatty alcohol dehydrogenase [Ophiobolus disseminans]|uniref:Long-chain-alcohol oxidase n=1 Tax=Ophiobolus disseminans TaxID=1469910 RepID=A0A6A7A3L4_9PLEO|nr:long-chain fatty alcohol dehydrogenase [Ophiobolus disseminans]
MSLPTEAVSPKATPLPPLPEEDPLTPAQWKMLLAIADAVIPAIKPTATANTRTEVAVAGNEYSTAVSALRALTPEDDHDADSAAKEYLADNASSNPLFKMELQRMFAMYMPQSTRKQLSTVLSILDTRAGSLALTGYLTPISSQPANIRESILKSWSTARLGPLRQLHRSLTVLSKQTWIKVTPSLRRVLGVPRVPTGMMPGVGHDYAFIQFPPGDKPEVIETDVIIIGSGCGGGVSAKNLAEAGHRVIVVEKGHHWTPDHFPMSEADGWNHLFMNGAFISSDDTSTSIVAGQSWGGGGTVNWSASLQTQGYVRREWASKGLPFFTSAEFQDSLDRVCERMGVSTEHVKHNPANEMLLEGARKLGWSHKAVPQNTGGNQHYCGHCTFGCGSCEKQGPSVSYLPDAARAGTQFIEGFHAEKIVFSKTMKDGKKLATGVQGTWTSRDMHGGVAGAPLVTRKVLIKAKRIIVAAGTMQSPLLLLRSGLSNPQIGRNLYVHPVMVIGSIHQQDIKPWEGGILTSVVNEFENLDNAGHGAKLEATNMIPSSWLIWLDWRGGLQYKLDAARLRHMAGYISIARDRDTGRVYPDPIDGRVRFEYHPSKFDKQHILKGLLALAELQYVAGASEIFTVLPGMRPFIRDPSLPASGDGINDPVFQAWLNEIKAKGFPSPESVFVSAHQMGTCRMSSARRDGVVDPQGRVWGTEGLYVTDASVFPSASGVNPMVTNMAISDWISRGIAEGLEGRAML